MNSLLDTNAISEFKLPKPDPGVIAFLRDLEFSRTYLSVITIAELRMGIERLTKGRRRAELQDWLERDLPLDFQDRVLPIADDVAHMCGRIRARAFGRGRPMSIADAFIAATAEVHGLTLVTRNAKDFEAWGGPIFNPWSQTST